MRRVPIIALIAVLIAPFASSSAQALKVLNLPDYGRWNRITSTTLSPDGKWMTYAYQPNEGDATLFVKQLDGDKLFTIPIGSAPAAAGGGGGGVGGGAGGAQFSDDSRFVAYYVNPPEPAGGRGGAAGGGGRGGRGGAPPAGAPAGGARATRRLEIIDLATGDKFPVPNAASSNSRKDRVARRSSQQDARRHRIQRRRSRAARSRDVTTRNTGNVNHYDFDDSGRCSRTRSTPPGFRQRRLPDGPADRRDARTQQLRSEYDQLAWSDDGADLVVLRGEKSREMKQRDNALLAWTGVGTPNAKRSRSIPRKDASFPKGMVVSEYTAPRWSKDGSRIFFGIKEQEPELAAADSLKANVDVWHWKDAEPQSVQIVRLQQERRATLPAAYLWRTRCSCGSATTTCARRRNDAKRKVGDRPQRRRVPRLEVEWGAPRADSIA